MGKRCVLTPRAEASTRPPYKCARTFGVWIMFNQAPDSPWPRTSEGPFSASWSATPNAPFIFGQVLTTCGASRGRVPFAVVAASLARPHAEPGEPTGYRFVTRVTHHDSRQSYSWTLCPRAAYCWVPDAFPHFPEPVAGPRTLVDFVAGGASFVVEALLTLSMYIHEEFETADRLGTLKYWPKTKSRGASRLRRAWRSKN